MNQFDYINKNGEIISNALPYLNDNRAFRYGDGLFETIRVVDGRPVNLQGHIDRLFQGAATLSFSVPGHYSLDFFKAEIGKLIGSNAIEGGAKLRLHLYRAGGGTYKSVEDSVNYLITAEPVNSNHFTINQEGLTIVPTKLYFINGKVKVQIAVAKGKKLYDKRQVKKTKDWNREKARLLSKNNK